MKQYKIHISRIMLFCVILVFAGSGYGQFFSGKWLGRAKLTTNHGADFASGTGVPGQGGLSYPGYEHSPFDLAGGHGTVIYSIRPNSTGTQDTTVSTVSSSNKPGLITEIAEPMIHKNLNFEVSTTEPEEYITSHLRYDLEYLEAKARVMAWAHPKYDDFIIYEVDLINYSDQPLKDVRWGVWWRFEQNQNGFSRDEKYLWNEERQMFVFYDDRTFDWSTEKETEYKFATGPVTGDAGDPGDIKVENGLRHELRSTAVYTLCNFSAPDDKNGDPGYHYNIVHQGNTTELEPGTPPHEAIPIQPDPPHEVLRKLSYEQPRMSWDEAAQDPNVQDGTKWEREPALVLSYGPYDFAPGETKRVVFGFVAGQMSRDKIYAGGLENVQKVSLSDAYTYPGSSLDEIWYFAKVGLDSLLKNHAAAKELIERNYAVDSFPPPTVGPEKGDYLSVVPEPGIMKISFPGIPDGYVDPAKGENDVAAYRIYRTPISLVGPWEKIGEISYAESRELLDEAGNVVWIDETPEPGIGYHYTVSSVDTDGHESTPVIYNRFVEFTQVAPGAADGSSTVVIPNPFRIVANYQSSDQENRITFMNVPGHCTIRIYNVAGELIREFEHMDGSGEQPWGSSAQADLQLSRYYKRVSPGIYVFHVESKVPGHEGETSIGKFAIIR